MEEDLIIFFNGRRPTTEDNLKVLKNSKFLCGHRKGHSPCLTPIWSLYTLLFVITSAHTLLGPFIQLYSGNFIQSLYTCTAFCHYKCIHFEWLSLLYILRLATHTRGAHTVLGSVVLLYIHTLVQSLFSGNVYTTALYNSLVPAWAITNVYTFVHNLHTLCCFPVCTAEPVY